MKKSFSNKIDDNKIFSNHLQANYMTNQKEHIEGNEEDIINNHHFRYINKKSATLGSSS